MSTIRLLVKPAIFTVGVCGTCFCTAAIVQYETNTSNFTRFKRRQPAVTIQDWVQRQHQRTDNLYGKFIDLRKRINAWKNSLATSEKIAYGTIFANLVVLVAWRAPGLRPVMTKYFLSQVSATKVALSPMVLSFFSHASPLHFAFNMYALFSFSGIATALLGPEQLIGLYISAGTVSSLASISHRLITKRFSPSLGASGALLGVVAYVCVVRPESSLLLFFIPIAAGNAIKGLLLLDTIGLVARWSFIDHAAHLGGSLFGVWYATYGEKLYYRYRGSIVENWLKYKNKYDD